MLFLFTMRKYIAAIITFVMMEAAVPAFASGACGMAYCTFKDFVYNLLLPNIIQPLVPLLMALTLVYFIWGVTKFVRDSDSDQARSQGRKIMISGVIALFVEVSIWGLVALLTQTFGLPFIIPQLQAPS